MDWFQKIGEGTGALAGGVIGGAFNLAAELTHAQLLQEAGAEVFQGNKNAGKYAGQTLDGVIDTAVGFFTKNDHQLHQGKEKLADVARTTVNGIGDTFGFAQEQITEAYEGGKEMDAQRLKQVARNTGKALLVSGAVLSVWQVGKGLKFKVK